ncbi:hypothetical protein ACQY74_000410 (plasmid) [Rhizobium leguminosarum bv. trifolii]|jgi:hypothetical protein
MARNPSLSWRGSGKGIDAFDHLFGRIPPRNETAGRVTPQAAPRRLRVLHFLGQQRTWPVSQREPLPNFTLP